jgi:hypothetical protein
MVAATAVSPGNNTPSWSNWDQTSPAVLHQSPSCHSPHGAGAVTAQGCQQQQQQYSPAVTVTAAGSGVLSPSNNSDGRIYHSPALSPGDWNVASPNSYMSDQPYTGASAFMSPNTAPAGIGHHSSSLSSPSTQSTWSMSSSSINTSNTTTQKQHEHGALAPPVLPANLGKINEKEQQQQPGQRSRVGKSSTPDVEKIQRSFLVKTSLDEGREKIASRRALDLIDAVAGGTGSGCSTHASSSSRRSYQQSSRAAAAAATSSISKDKEDAVNLTNIPVKNKLTVPKTYNDPPSHQSSGSSIGSTGSSSRNGSSSSFSSQLPKIGKEHLATSDWSKKKKNDEPMYRETVHDYKTSVRITVNMIGS